MRSERAQTYRDQYEFLADCFELIRKRGDAFNIRNEAQETERMVRYSERTGFQSERSHLLEIYRDIEGEIAGREKALNEKKARTLAAGRRFPFDLFAEKHVLTLTEQWIVLVLLYNESVGRTQARFQTGNEILNLLSPNPVNALKASRYLDAEATLLNRGLVRSVDEDPLTNLLRAGYEVTETTLSEILGIHDRGRIRTRNDAGFAAGAAPAPDRPYRIVGPRVSLDQVALPEEFVLRLEELIWQVEQGDRLFEEWGLGRVLEKGKGTIVLFAGPPGTGKTMTAEALATRLGRSLFVADYSQIESKWIGDTEKNIVSVFREARAARAVLLLDEADAILASRLQGGHYNDRAYNRQVSLLLTEIENYEGVCILTTNQEVSLDRALARRISARFDFPVPGVAQRLRIWRTLITPELPLAGDVDLAALARAYPISGGGIKNVILSAVRRAARRDGEATRVRQEDFTAAAALERESFEARTRGIGFHDAPGLSFS